ncbi:sigma factor, partial [Oscillibacter sp.]|uniref:RNA polymerase sigma factor n=1 Tax=Oscillibacter sp. TaxID=1945593 RepID=UPI00216DAF49
MLPLMITAIEDENDREFMERLYLQYHRLIYSEVRKLLQNEDEAEDLMQTVVEKLIHKVDLLRDLERRRLVNYVISTAKNTAQNFLRNTRPEARVWAPTRNEITAPRSAASPKIRILGISFNRFSAYVV